MEVKVKTTHPDAQAPKRAYPGDCCFDLTIATGRIENNYIEYDTGLAMEIPVGYVGLIFPVPSVSSAAIDMPNAVFIIEPGNRRSIKLRFRHPQGGRFHKGDVIARIIILETPPVAFRRVNDLSPSDRDIDEYDPRNMS